MLVALTVRKLKAGAAEDFLGRFVPREDEEPPPGWKRFYGIRSTSDPDEVITFGFFDGTLEELNASQSTSNFDERKEAIADLVEEVKVNGVYELVAQRDLG